MIDLSFKYSPLVQLDIQHEYYNTAPARNLAFIPTEATASVLNYLQLILRYDENGMKILLDEQHKEALLQQLEQLEDRELNFWIQADSPYFKYLTSEADTSLKNIFFFHNTGENSIDDSILLHNKEAVSASSEYSISDASVTLEKGESVLSLSNKNFEYKPSDNQQIIILAPGAYHVQKGGKVIKKLIVLENRKLRYPVALVNISIDALLESKISDSVKKGEPLKETKYKIQFDSRESFWRYTVVPKYVERIDKVYIQSEEKQVKFNKPEKVILNGGYEAYSFQSHIPIKWHELSPYTFKLSKTNGSKSASKVLIKRLPVPTVDNLIVEEQKKQQIFLSNIVVYL